MENFINKVNSFNKVFEDKKDTFNKALKEFNSKAKEGRENLEKLNNLEISAKIAFERIKMFLCSCVSMKENLEDILAKKEKDNQN